MKKQSRYISNENKEIILKRQNYRCANTPGANLYRIGVIFVHFLYDSNSDKQTI